MADPRDPKPKVTPKDPYESIRKEGPVPLYETILDAPSIYPGSATGSQYAGRTEYSDPFWTGGGDRDAETRMKAIEAGFDVAQPWYDKLGNGMAKLTGSFGSGLLSVPGTIWGLASGIATTAYDLGESAVTDREVSLKDVHMDNLWNNAFTEAGNSLVNAINESNVNYKSLGEQNAGAWSPKSWATWNFFSDNILGNAGYALAAYATGFGVSKLLTKMAPYIAGKEVKTALDIVKTQGIEALSEYTHLAGKLRRWDRIQQGVSLGIAAMSEASTEAYSSYEETKRKLFGDRKESEIDPKELEKIEQAASDVANIVYGVNIPILGGLNFAQFGKSLLGFSSEFKNAAKSKISFATPRGLLGGFAEKEHTKGFMNSLWNATKSIGRGAKTNIGEAAQEGFQYVTSEGTKNYFTRKHLGEKDSDNVIQAYLDAGESLVKSKEGVANLLGGFGTPVVLPHAWKDIKQAMFGTDKKKTTDFQLSMLNSLNAKETIKAAAEASARHFSLQKDLNDAIANSDEFEARNLHNDIIKNYVESRIKAGRFDILQDELKQMAKMDNENFKQFFGIDTNTDIDHKKLLDGYTNKAKDMQRTWAALDRVFIPQLYDLPENKEEREKAVNALANYKEMAWSYLMDAKDSDQRLNILRKEVDEGLGGILSLKNIFNEKTKDPKLNSLINEYNTVAVEMAVREKLDPDFTNQKESGHMKLLIKRIKAKVQEHVKNNLGSLGLPEYMEKGDPEYIEQYLFDVNKQLSEIKADAVFNKALSSNDSSAILDTSEITKKLNDLRRLDKRRMLAIQSYNNLSSIIREGKYKDPIMKNPFYESDPENQPEFIANEELLRGDNYKQLEDERDKFNKEQAREADINRKKQAAFQTGLDNDNQLVRKGATDEQKAFRERYNYYYNGDKNNKGFKFMTPIEFNVASARLNEALLRINTFNPYRAFTDQERTDFDHAGYRDIQARIKAHTDAVAFFNKRARKAAEKAGQKVAANYKDIYNEQGVELAEKYYDYQLKEFAKKFDAEGIKMLMEEVDNLRRDLGVLKDEGVEQESPEHGDQIDEQADLETVVDEEAADTATATDPITELFGPKGTMDEEKKPVANKPTSTKKQMQTQAEPNNLAATTSEEDNRNVNDLLTAMELLNTTYLVFRKSDLENTLTYAPVKTLNKVTPGTQINHNGNIGIVTAINEESVVYQDKEGNNYRIARNDLEEAAKQGLLQKGYYTNVYNTDGSVKTKQFDPQLADPKSPYFLSPGKRIKLVRNGKDKKGYPFVQVYVQGSFESDWYKTTISYSLDPSRIAAQFRKNVPDATIAAITAKVEALSAKVKSNKEVHAVISPDVNGFGKLIFNQGDFGERESFSVDKAFNIKTINDTSKVGGVLFAVVGNDDVEGNDVRQMTEGGSMFSLNTMHDVYIPQSSIDAITKTGNKAGQGVMALPTGKIHEGKQVYILVSLNTRNMSEDLSTTMKRDNGQPMTLGEAVLDVILNPHKPEYQTTLAALFQLVGKRYDPAKPDWEGFYTNENMYDIFNRIFFTAGKSIADSRFKFPFAIYADTSETLDGKSKTTKVTINITKGQSALRSLEKQVSIFITSTDGTLNKTSVDDRMDAFLNNTQTAKNLDKTLSYEEIQDSVAPKPYRIDLKKASKKATGPYDAIVFDDKGYPSIKRFESYWHYVESQKLLTSTVQGISEGEARFYFVNTPISYNFDVPQEETKLADKINSTETVGRSVQEAKKEGLLNSANISEADAIAAVEKALTDVPLKGMNVMMAKGDPIAFLKYVAQQANNVTETEEYNKTHDSRKSALESFKQPLIDVANKMFPQYKEIADKAQAPKTATIPGSAIQIASFVAGLTNKAGLANWSGSVKDVSEALGINADKASLKELKEAAQVVLDKALKAKQSVPTPSVSSNIDTINKLKEMGIETDNKGTITSSFGDKLKNFGKAKGLIDFTKIVTVNQYTLDNMDAEVSAIAAGVTRELTNMLLDEYSYDKASKFNRTKLKRKLLERLGNKIERLQYEHVQLINEGADKDKIAQSGDRIEAYRFAMRYFDHDDIQKEISKEERDSVSTVDSNGKRHYFLGFYNLALNDLFKSRIVDVWANGRQMVDFADEGGTNYTMRYDDGWSFKIDPRETLGKYSRMILSTVPEYSFDAAGELQPVTDGLGEQRNIAYESVYKALIAQGVELKSENVFEFFETLNDNASTVASPVLQSVYKKLQDIKTNFGIDSYNQTIRQLAPSILLQQANQLIIETQTSLGRKAKGRRLNAKDKMWNLSRQMVNDEILSRWSANFSNMVRAGKYIEVSREPDKESGQNITQYSLKLMDDKTLMDYIRDKLIEAGTLKGDAKLRAMAEVYVNDLGFPLTGTGTVEDTMNVLKTWNTKKKKGALVFKQHFKGRQYASLDEMVRDTLVNYIAKPIEDAVRANTFRLEEPLYNSTTTLNDYAKALKGQFPDVVNASVNDINNKTRYIYIAPNNLSEQMLDMKNIDYMWDVANSTYGRYMPAISGIFQKDAKGDYIGKHAIDIDAWDKWQRQEMDYVNGIIRDDFIRQEAKSAKAGSWDLISLKAFQNSEEHKEGKGRGDARYVISFGDATAAPYFKGEKQMFAAIINSNTAIPVISLQDEVNGVQVSSVKEQMFQIFLAEINRSFEAVKKFTKTKKSDVERQLRPGNHYIKIGKNYHMGAMAGIYNFGENIFNLFNGYDSPFFTTADIATESGTSRLVVTGIKKDMLKRGKLDHDRIRLVFNDFIDGFVSELVEAKMQQLAPFKNEFLEITKSAHTDGTPIVNYKMPLFANEYVNSLSRNVISKGRVTVDGTSLSELYQSDPENYAEHLFRTMILDQQINHFIFRANFTAANGIDPALYQKEGATDHDSFYDNWDKRMKGMVTPKGATANLKEDKVHIVTYADPKLKDVTRKFTLDDQSKLNGFQRQLIDYMRNSPRLKSYVRSDKQGVLTMPERIIGHQVETMFYLNRDMWDAKEGATDLSRKDFDKQVAGYLETKPMDGFSAITLKEYLYRKYLDGQIKNEEEFNTLFQYYNNPDLVMTADQYRDMLPMQVLKYVMSGSKIDAGEIVRIYGKDAEFPLLPVLTKDSHWDDIRKDLHAMEGTVDNQPVTLGPGINLKPQSAMKLGGTSPIALFDNTGTYSGQLKDAVVAEWKRSVSGKQIQNPDKQNNLVTGSNQADKFVHNDVDNNTIIGETVFEQNVKSAEGALEEALSEGNNLKAIAAAGRMVQDSKREEPRKRQGVYNSEMMAMKFDNKAEMMRRDLEELMDQWGLKYEVAGEDYQRLIERLGLDESASPEDLAKFMDSEDPEEAEVAYQAYKIRKRIVTDNINEMLNDVKAQLVQQKGLTINNIYMLRLAEGMQNTMDIPLTFAPNSSQIQSVILSRINKIINGRKLPGYGLVQMPSLGFQKKVQGNSSLKGYTPQLDDKGNFVGINAAEITMPWRMTDPVTGDLLDFNKYCFPDGSPRPEMFDKRALQVIGLRIPGTGANTLGFFNIVRFTPGYKDAAQVPQEIVAQMNSDFDFDKLYSYVSNYTVNDKTGKVEKIQGFLHHSQKGVAEFLNSKEAKLAAIKHQLETNDPAYLREYQELRRVIDAKVRSVSYDLLETANAEKDQDEEADTVEDLMALNMVDKAKLLKTKLNPQDMELLDNRLAALNQKVEKAAADFDMDKFLEETPKALNVIQTRQQLENAQIDSYHIMLRNKEVARKMLKPLTTGWIKSQLETPAYNGISIKGMRSNQQFKSPLAEVSNSNTKVSNSGADLMIGIMANAQSMIHYAQHADLTLSNEYAPILFNDSKGNVLQEEKYDKDMFTISERQFKQTIDKFLDTIQTEGRIRLGRIYGRDEHGNLVSVSSAIQSILQAALDNQNDPLLGIGGINADVASEMIAMLLLGYMDHVIPFLNQPIIKDHVKISQQFSGVMRASSLNDEMMKMITPYLERAGLYDEVMDKVEKDEGDPDKFKDVLKVLDRDYIKPFSVKELRDNIMKAPDDPANNADQLSALAMFYRVKAVGASLSELQNGINVESKGFKEVSIVGVDRQLTDFNKVQNIPILNIEKVTDPRSKLFNTVLAARYGLNTVRDLFQYGKTNMFEDLSPAMKTMRSVASYLNRKNRSADLEQQINVGVIQFILSDPTLYRELINDIAGEVEDSSEVRELLMKENYGTIPEGDKQRYDLSTNTASTVAGLLEKVSKQKDENGIPYEQRYEVIANLRPIVQKNNDNPSAIVYPNANNYKQRLDVLLPKSIMQMLQDPNPDVQTLAKMLILYSYMTGGTNNPISYLTSLPQEVMARYKFGERIRQRMAQLNEGFAALNSEYERRNLEYGLDDESGYVNKLLSGRYTSAANMGALNVLRSFVYQYYQHHPYDLRRHVQAGDHADPDNIVIKDAKEAMVMGITKGRPEIYIANFDHGGTYRQADALGYRYNISEYAFNNNGWEGMTIVNTSSRIKQITPLPAIVTAEQDKAYTVPYMLGRTQASLTEEYLNSYTAPLRSSLSWVAENSIAKADASDSERTKQIQGGIAAIANYLNKYISPALTYGLNTKLTVNGRTAAGKADLDANGAVTKIWLNPAANEQDDRSVHFKGVMLHEGTHAALSHVIETIKRVNDKKITDEDAAKILGVTLDNFQLQKEGYKRLSAMLKNRKVADSLRKAYAQAYAGRYKNVPTNLANMENEQDIARIAQGISDYSLSDVEEFIAFVLSDRDYRDALNKIDYEGGTKNKSIWKRLIELFADILGIRSGSALEETFYDIMSLTEPLKGAEATLGGSPVSTKALISFNDLAVPFPIDVEDVTERYNFKQENC